MALIPGTPGDDNLSGTTGNDEIHGEAGDDRLSGGDGNDILYGGAGNDDLDGYFGVFNGAGGADLLRGGAGWDDYYIDNIGDVVDEAYGASGEWEVNTVTSRISFDLGDPNRVKGNYVNDLFLDGNGHIDGWGTSSDDSINGNFGNNRLFGRGGEDDLRGRAGNDYLDGGAGADRLMGGAGNDFYIIDNTGDRILEDDGAGDGGIDTVRSYISFSLVASSQVEGNFERLELLGSSNINGTGNSLNNIIIGNTGNNTLNGGAGNDILNGGIGDDVLRGGTGNDLYYVNAPGDQAIELAGQGIDTVRSYIGWTLGANIEHLGLLGATNINATGNSLNNILTGNAGDNSLNGGKGVDQMIGGAGNDRYYVDNSADVIIEKSNEGTGDRVYASTNYSLKSGVGVEILSATSNGGTAALKLAGNSYANTIVGNAGANFINGGLGADTLTGLGGKDTFMFNTALGSPNVDTITDFNVADDTIRLENAIFTAISGTGTLTAAQFVKNATGLAEDANDRIIYETDTGKLFYDANGSASGGRLHFATLDKNLALTASDFFIV